MIAQIFFIAIFGTLLAFFLYKLWNLIPSKSEGWVFIFSFATLLAYLITSIDYVSQCFSLPELVFRFLSIVGVVTALGYVGYAIFFVLVMASNGLADSEIVRTLDSQKAKNLASKYRWVIIFFVLLILATGLSLLPWKPCEAELKPELQIENVLRKHSPELVDDFKALTRD